MFWLERSIKLHNREGKIMPLKNALPQFQSYGPYSGNYGVHAMQFTDAMGNRYWFSYNTLVAFDGPKGGRKVIRNYWGPTTGKHLNAIDGGNKASRLTETEFQAAFLDAFGVSL
jgi:hypothetical protein